MLKRITLCSTVVLLLATILVDDYTGFSPGKRGGNQHPLKRLVQKLKREINRNPDFEATGNTDLAQQVREAFTVKSDVLPQVVAQSPLDGANIPEGDSVTFQLQLVNWLWQPDQATSAGTEYANGNQEPNKGHLHAWIYDLQTGELVRFYGANLNGGVTYDSNTGALSFTESYDPGIYKIYFQAQNNDHTGQAVPAAPNLPAIDTLVFTVGDFTLDDLQL